MIKEQLEKIIKEPILGFNLLDSGWYIVERQNQPESKRYNVAQFKTIKGIEVILYDFKTGESHKLYTSSNDKTLTKFAKNKAAQSDEPLEHEETTRLYNSGTRKDNGYLKKKKLNAFSTEFLKVKTIRQKGQDVLLIPYSTFDLYPKFVGGKLITPDGTKFCVKGSKMKGSFHAHNLEDKNTLYIIGEGYAECFIAANLINNSNVLEAGGCQNVINLINQIPEGNTIYVLAENDSKEFYDKVAKTYERVKVVYPPDEKCKDFGDYYEKEGLSKTKVALLGSDFKQKSDYYKPLGIQNQKPVVYSKILNDLVELNPNNLEDNLRFCYDIEVAHQITLDKKKLYANRIFLECAQLGPIENNNKLPIGLWKNDNSEHYYNDGSKLFRLGKESLTVHTYDEITTAEFLLCKVPGFGRLPLKEFNNQKELVELMELCDWEHKAYARVLLGFLVQSYFAGVHDFRPHVWFESRTPHSGKSWLSNWIRENLITLNFSREAGKSSVAGTTQGMQNLAGVLFCDEVAEKDSTYKKENTQMIELLRSAATASSPIVLGTPDQIPKKILARFSALLSCIDGKELLKEQDFTRILFLNFGIKKGSFEEDALPRFKAFSKDKLGLGFGAHALKGFYMFNDLYTKYHVELTKNYRTLRHKARGIASCIAGYGVFMRSEAEADKLYADVLKTDLMESFTDVVQDVDFLDTMMTTLVNTRDALASDMDAGKKPLIDIIKENGEIKNFGIKYDKGKIQIYNVQFKNFIELYFTSSRLHVLTKLQKSKYFAGKRNTRFGKMPTVVLMFDYEL